MFIKSLITKTILILLIFSGSIFYAQEIVISGTISDEFGEVSDISVQIKGTQKGTVTDFDGNFSIKVNIGDVLIFSHVLFQTEEVIITEKKRVDLTLKEHGSNIIFCDFGPYKWINLSYYRNYNYNLDGLKAALTVRNVYTKRNLYIKGAYLTNFKNDQEYNFSIGTNYTIKDHFTRIFATYDSKNITSIVFNRKAFIVESSIGFKVKTLVKNTNFYYGLGLAKLNNKAWKPGYKLGISLNVFNGVTIYNNLFYWSDYWQIDQGVNWKYKRFTVAIAHQKIKEYNTFTSSFGYRYIF